MKHIDWRRCAVTLIAAVAVSAGLIRTATADVDLTGPWALTIDIDPPIALTFDCTVEVVQAGTSLSLVGPCAASGIAVTGTIDPVSGAFTLTGAGPGVSVACPGVVLTGSSTPSGDAFSGALACTGPEEITGSFSASLCGNGQIDAGEDCDDDQGCCTEACELEANGAPCDSECVPGGTCDGAGNCVGTPASAGQPCASDGNFCTFDVCDGAGLCTHVCSDCCDSSLGFCIPAAFGGCRRVTEARATLRSVPGGVDRLKWTWRKGSQTAAGDFGDPTTTTDYTLCLYQNAPGTLTSRNLFYIARAPSGDLCRGPSWKAFPKGFKYRDPCLSPDGIKNVLLKAGVDGKARVAVKVKGNNKSVQFPAGPKNLPVTAELRASTGECWTSVFSTAQANFSTAFRARLGSPGAAFLAPGLCGLLD